MGGAKKARRGILDNITGALGGGNGNGNAGNGAAGGLGGILGGLGGATGAGGTPTPKGTVEEGVAKSAGNGAESGLPTCSDNGEITMTFHQINQGMFFSFSSSTVPYYKPTHRQLGCKGTQPETKSHSLTNLSFL